ncbi:oligosaccharide flippase family protein [Aliarcobacter lanthieri]|uniref:oligosaccharide flippase family protein n=1 Tax=Aliarcobacter lanthieri TaxID=1355374 RepID=UPI00047CE6C5|nr:oligosaccharide flippase family protein [Aliarcobacter lanthieri]
MNLKKLLSVYTLISLYQALITFLLMSLFSYIMNINTFGSYNLYLAIIPFLFNLLLLGTTGALSVFYYKVNLNKFRLYISQIVFFILPISFMLGILLYFIFSGLVAEIFQLNTNTLFLLILLTFSQILPQILLTYYQTIQRVDLYFKLNFSYLSSNFIFSIISFLVYNEIYFIFLFMLINAVIFSCYSIYILYRYNLLVIRFNIFIFKNILNFGLPLVVHATGTTLLFMSDRFIISNILGNESVGLYSISLQLSMIMLILVNSFTSAWGPYLFKTMKETKNIIDFSFMKKIYIFIAIFFIMPLFLYYIQMIILNVFFNNNYKEAINYVLIIGFGYSMMGIYKIFIGFLHFQKKTKLISFLTIFSLLINISISYYLVQKIGLIGASYGTLISMFILSIFTIFFVNKYYKLNWRLK